MSKHYFYIKQTQVGQSWESYYSVDGKFREAIECEFRPSMDYVMLFTSGEIAKYTAFRLRDYMKHDGICARMGPKNSYNLDVYQYVEGGDDMHIREDTRKDNAFVLHGDGRNWVSGPSVYHIKKAKKEGRIENWYTYDASLEAGYSLVRLPPSARTDGNTFTPAEPTQPTTETEDDMKNAELVTKIAAMERKYAAAQREHKKQVSSLEEKIETLEAAAKKPTLKNIAASGSSQDAKDKKIIKLEKDLTKVRKLNEGNVQRNVELAQELFALNAANDDSNKTEEIDAIRREIVALMSRCDKIAV